MWKKFNNKIAFRALVLLTVTCSFYYPMVYSGKRTWHWLQAVTTQKSLCLNLKLQLKNFIYGDLSEQFEIQASVFRWSTDVFKALKSDGYTPIALSMNILDQNFQKQTENSSAENLNATFSAVLNNATDAKVEVSVSKSTSLNFLVPNVVHYIVFGTDLTFTFTNYLSYLSVERFIQPEQIFLHGDNIPSGPWWNLTIHNVRNIYLVKRTRPRTAPNGVAFKYAAQISDYVRTEILLRYGGIYMDADVLVIKSFAPLRQYSVTLSRERTIGVCNGIILAEKGAPFLRLLREQYHSYVGDDEIWTVKSFVNTHLLSKIYPHLVHIEDLNFNRPYYKQRALLYSGRYNWTEDYAVHLWMRLWPKEIRPNGLEDILMKKTTFAEVARMIIFGSADLKANGTG